MKINTCLKLIMFLFSLSVAGNPANAQGFGLQISNVQDPSNDLLAQFSLAPEQPSSLGTSFVVAPLVGAAPILAALKTADNRTIPVTCLLPGSVAWEIRGVYGMAPDGKLLAQLYNSKKDTYRVGILNPTGSKVISYCPTVTFRIDNACKRNFYVPSTPDEGQEVIDPATPYIVSDIYNPLERRSHVFAGQSSKAKCVIDVTIRDSSGKPLKGKKVQLITNSYRTGKIKVDANRKTDNRGHVRVQYLLAKAVRKYSDGDVTIDALVGDKSWASTSWSMGFDHY